jgi:DNA-binding GntR family transcriptional regulator
MQQATEHGVSQLLGEIWGKPKMTSILRGNLRGDLEWNLRLVPLIDDRYYCTCARYCNPDVAPNVHQSQLIPTYTYHPTYTYTYTYLYLPIPT